MRDVKAPLPYGRGSDFARLVANLRSLPLNILFEDEHLLVLNKPPGLATQAPAGIDSLEARVRAYLQSNLRESSPAGGGQGEGAGGVSQSSPHPHPDPLPRGEGEQAQAVYLGLPHRLDRPVSGVIVFAKTRKAAQKLSKQFEYCKVKKIYWAALEGIVEPAAGTWIDTLCKVPDEARVEVVAADSAGAQPAILHYRTLGRTPHSSLLEIELETGRMHQIRVQAAARGWPVIGDAQYGSSIPFGEQCEDLRQRAIALHARSLSIMPPRSAAVVTFTAPVGKDWPAANSD